MDLKPLAFTQHARDAIDERELQLAWIERTAREPEWATADKDGPGVERRFRSISERGGKILRVVVVEDLTDIRILTAFFDRKAKRP